MEARQEQDLAHLIDIFGENNEKVKELKKICDSKNQEIKAIMAEEKLDYFSTNEFSASYIIKQTTKVNEEKLLALLQATDGDKFREIGIIQSKEYVDPDSLENAIYEGYIDNDLLSRIKECYTETSVPTLTVKKKGKK